MQFLVNMTINDNMIVEDRKEKNAKSSIVLYADYIDSISIYV